MDLSLAAPRAAAHFRVCGVAPRDVVAPASVEEVAEILAAASRDGRATVAWGGGTFQGWGPAPMRLDLVLCTDRLAGIEAYDPQELVLVARAGTPLAHIDAELAAAGQALPFDQPPGRTLGGAIAAPLPGLRRLRYGAVRTRVLEVTVVTGDGRVVRGGGRVVKNVSGYSVPALVTGSRGTLGVIVSAAVKVMPGPASSVVLRGELAPEAALARLYRPAAVAEDRSGTWVVLDGHPDDVGAQAALLPELVPTAGPPPAPEGERRGIAHVAPAALPSFLRALPSGLQFLAHHGVGTLEAAGGAEIAALPPLAAAHGGWAETLPADAPPPLAHGALLDRVKATFDPAGILAPGRLW